MSEEPELELDVREIIPARVRTWAYVGAVIVGACAMAAAQIVPIWAPDVAGQVTATANIVLGLVAVVTGALGTVYRPSDF